MARHTDASRSRQLKSRCAASTLKPGFFNFPIRNRNVCPAIPLHPQHLHLSFDKYPIWVYNVLARILGQSRKSAPMPGPQSSASLTQHSRSLCLRGRSDVLTFGRCDDHLSVPCAISALARPFSDSRGQSPATHVFSFISKLFASSEHRKYLVFKKIRTLSAKLPGCGIAPHSRGCRGGTCRAIRAYISLLPISSPEKKGTI